ncbi:MAG: hypothetical protein WC901_04670 [Candidatus Margulisiibacteriota bacterium]
MRAIHDLLPDTKKIAVIGGTKLIPDGITMAHHVGRAIIDAGCCLVTGGRMGAGRAASEGAAAACRDRGLDVLQHVIAIVPEGDNADFRIGTVAHIGSDKVARRVALVTNTVGAIVIGGGKGTRSEVLIAVMEAIMDGYSIIPVSGTGGEADRMSARVSPFPDALLNNTDPSPEKANVIVKVIQQVPCWYCDIDPVQAHYDWLESPSKDKTGKKMFRIRHKYF